MPRICFAEGLNDSPQFGSWSEFIQCRATLQEAIAPKRRQGIGNLYLARVKTLGQRFDVPALTGPLMEKQEGLELRHRMDVAADQFLYIMRQLFVRHLRSQPALRKPGYSEST